MTDEIYKDKKLIKILKDGGVAIIPTDTVYGIVAKAENALLVESIYKVRKRNPEKPCIILIGDINELEKFSIVLTEAQKEKLKEFWPGPVSIIFDCLDDSLKYLHRGTNTLAFRLPKDKNFRDFLNEVGPLIAPSANPEGYPTAKDTNEAQEYFGNAVDYYLDGGISEGKPSKVIRLQANSVVSILRE